MALFKKLLVDSMYEPEYWVIDDVRVDNKNKQIAFSLMAYRTEADKKIQKAKPTAVQSFLLTDADYDNFAAIDKPLYKALYGIIKSLSQSRSSAFFISSSILATIPGIF